MILTHSQLKKKKWKNPEKKKNNIKYRQYITLLHWDHSSIHLKIVSCIDLSFLQSFWKISKEACLSIWIIFHENDSHLWFSWSCILVLSCFQLEVFQDHKVFGFWLQNKWSILQFFWKMDEWMKCTFEKNLVFWKKKEKNLTHPIAPIASSLSESLTIANSMVSWICFFASDSFLKDIFSIMSMTISDFVEGYWIFSRNSLHIHEDFPYL